MYLILLHGDNPFCPPSATRRVFISREAAQAEVDRLNDQAYQNDDTGHYSIQELIVQDNL
jgi:hypothetical protein